MNIAIIEGRLTNDVELKYFQSGNNTAFTRFSVAVNRDYKDKDGNYPTDFLNVEAFGKLAEACANFTGKGLRVVVTGSIQTDKFQDQNGQNKTYWKIRAEKVKFIDFKNSKQQQADPQQGYVVPQGQQYGQAPQQGYVPNANPQVGGYATPQQVGFNNPQQAQGNMQYGQVPQQGYGNPQPAPNGFNPNAGGWVPMEDIDSDSVPF